jgi:hypothetical protein
MALDVGQINVWAVLVSAVVVFLLGGLWYTALFGELWKRLHGISEEQARAMQAQMSPPLFFGGMLASYLVLAVVMAVLFRWGSVQSAGQGVGWALACWLGPTASLKMTDHIASGKPIGAFLLDSSFQLIAMVVTGAILGGW